jgi:hypothetical protein
MLRFVGLAQRSSPEAVAQDDSLVVQSLQRTGPSLAALSQDDNWGIDFAQGRLRSPASSII